MIRLVWFLCCGLSVISGQQDPEFLAKELEEAEITDYTLIDNVARRVPRHSRVLQRLETRPRMSEFSVRATIISRYAFTTVSCTLVNSGSEAREGVFEMQIPATAFISNFTMVIGDRVYHGDVVGKERKPLNAGRKNRYSRPTEEGENGVEMFQASGVIPRKAEAIFLLHYEELLQRRLGKYQYTISIRPQQLVGKLRVEVNILENSGINSLEVPPLRKSKSNVTGENEDDASPPPSTVVGQTKTLAKVTFSPTVVQQAKIARNGILGDFIIRYDVNRELSVGDVQVLNGYFVHCFAPKDLPPLPKNVVFVLDTSASMVGLKLRQTKEALFTILQDLRSEDHFNIIGFSNRIKIWQHDQLMPVTPNNIRDAKIYIHNLSPTGGTNINGALQISTKILSDYIAQNDIEPQSVSLIIFLTDGRPTAGETEAARIINNTKEAIRNKFCLFTIGIGNDVDYKLLERLALENCGMMRRVREDEDAAAQLKGFYDEIGTPLLSDIRVDYPTSSVDQVTQNLFPNYFNGSEIVIAGKLFNKTANSLHVEVTASNNDKYVLLKTDVAINLSGKNHIGGASNVGGSTNGQNYVERAWSYLTIKELLTSWLKSDNSEEKESLREKAKELALMYHFVTPFTMLKMKELALQAELPKEIYVGPLMEDVGEIVQGLQGHRAPPVLDSVPGRPEKQRTKVTKTSADGDPHFVVDFPLSKLTVCFNIDGEPGDILRLVSDHKNSGVTVNGQLIGAPAPRHGHKKQRTYFRSITILSNKPERSYLEVTPTKVILDDGKRLILPCDRTAMLASKNLEVSIFARSNVTVVLRGTIGFVILIHHYKNPAPYQKDHLGFYISNSKGLSAHSHGLLGQFLHQDVKLIQEPLRQSHPMGSWNQTKGIDVNSGNVLLKLKGRLVPVVWKQRKIYNGEQEVDCWFAKNNAEKLIDGPYRDYLASHPFDTGTSNLMDSRL
ncbi:inter-alpha-trypsin inhibitor heavy chain H5 isoform X2 [Sceloporus undulatus]|uniref:inter-alpha-trypsin inhibitor heavy chain H5 isoform X2 n=1 Tax=Sceloporus undulatus TaxID=8520 RepID=UPI001C4AD734|nr:inter-alpha-trypsin inhibitor heavy chain H5 isoform X2 [Sceloporus undulatus]